MDFGRNFHDAKFPQLNSGKIHNYKNPQLILEVEFSNPQLQKSTINSAPTLQNSHSYVWIFCLQFLTKPACVHPKIVNFRACGGLLNFTNIIPQIHNYKNPQLILELECSNPQLQKSTINFWSWECWNPRCQNSTINFLDLGVFHN